jgi:hypothetical protein
MENSHSLRKLTQEEIDEEKRRTYGESEAVLNQVVDNSNKCFLGTKTSAEIIGDDD